MAQNENENDDNFIKSIESLFEALDFIDEYVIRMDRSEENLQ